MVLDIGVGLKKVRVRYFSFWQKCSRRLANGTDGPQRSTQTSGGRDRERQILRVRNPLTIMRRGAVKNLKPRHSDIGEGQKFLRIRYFTGGSDHSFGAVDPSPCAALRAF